MGAIPSSVARARGEKMTRDYRTSTHGLQEIRILHDFGFPDSQGPGAKANTLGSGWPHTYSPAIQTRRVSRPFFHSRLTRRTFITTFPLSFETTCQDPEWLRHCGGE